MSLCRATSRLPSFAALTLTLAMAMGTIVLPGRAQGDGDPASDVLLGLSAFYPYVPAVSTPLQNQLQRELAELAHRGLNLKVAIIESPTDLGAIPALFGKPQAYANFLEREISFAGPQPLLVVMPQGFGLAHTGPAGALDGLKVDSAGRSNGLARSAILAVPRIARAAGKPLPATAAVTGPSSSTAGNSSLIGFAVLAVLLVSGASIVLFRRRRVVASTGPPVGRSQSRARSRPGRSGKDR
jgi:hypothetical protein